jgi:cytochrome c-type biogenesis protein CcmF
VGAPYYDRVALPLAAALLLAMVVGPLLPWRRARGEDLLARLAAPVVVGCLTVVLVTLLAPASPLPVVSFGLAATLASSIVLEVVRGARRGRASEPGLRLDRRRAGGLVVHLGVALVAVGIAASSAYHVVAERTLAPGQSTTVAGTTVRLQDVSSQKVRGNTDTTATLAVRLSGQDRVTAMSPGLTYYPDHDTTVAVPAVASRLRGDVYLTLMSAGARHATVRVAVNPLVGWIWGGGAVMVLGAAVAGWPAALRRRKSQAVPVPVVARVSEPVP